MSKLSFIFVQIKFKIMKEINPDLIFEIPKAETTICKVLAVNSFNYETDKGYINKNYCFCNPATTSVGDTIKVRTKFLQVY